MSTFKSDTFPVVAAPLDSAWAVFRDFETLGEVYIESITAYAKVQVASGATFDPTGLGTPTILTFNQAGVTQRLTLPLTGTAINRCTNVLPLSGRVKVTFTGPSQFTTFMQAPPVSTFGPL